MLLYIIRHGDPIYETDSLTERGKLQAEALAKRMKSAGINKVFSSPMGRARMTAEPTCRLLGLECNIEKWAHEIYDPFPDINQTVGRITQNIYERGNGSIDIPYEHAFECEGFNTPQMKDSAEFIKREGNAFLERLGYKEENGIYRVMCPNNDKIALFCHAVMGRVWLSTLLHIPVHLMWLAFSYTHTGVTIIEFPNTDNGVTVPRCRCFSDMSHLFYAGLDMKHDNYIDI